MCQTTTFAMMDRGLLNAGLFRPLPRCGRPDLRSSEIEVTVVSGKRNLLVSSPSILGADDLRFLLALLALAAIQKRKINATDSDECHRDLIQGLATGGWYATSEYLKVEISRSGLCREADLKVSGAAYHRMNASLERLAAVICHDGGPVDESGRSSKARGCGERLLCLRRDERFGRMAVILNSRLSSAITEGGYVRIDLNESRSLGEMARLLHLRWCSIVREGETIKVGTDRLCDMIYGSEPESSAQRSRRKEEIRRGMSFLARLPGWSVIEHRRAMFEVTRPSRELREARENDGR